MEFYMGSPQGKKVLFIGDSITDCGRARPFGQMPHASLGEGYVSLVHALLWESAPEKSFDIINTGVSGNRITDLLGRWNEDVLDHRPDVLSILIGINDVWRHFDSPNIKQVSTDLFESSLEEALQATFETTQKIILMSPFYLEVQQSDAMRHMMSQYAHRVKALAQKHKLPFVDLQAAFDRYMAKAPSQTLASDRVHPNLIGHMLIARQFIAAGSTFLELD